MRGKDLNKDFAPKVEKVMKSTLKSYSLEFGLALGPIKATVKAIPTKNQEQQDLEPEL